MAVSSDHSTRFEEERHGDGPAEIGVSRVWFHRSFGEGSVSEEAVALCREHRISAIVGGCPMMYCTPDIAHRCMRWVLGWTGGISAQPR